MKSLLLGLLLLLAAGCAIQDGSTIVTGTKRPAISPGQVKVYLSPPASYEEVASISASAKHAFMSEEERMELAVANAKERAAKLGANGIILLSTAGITQTNVIINPGAYSSVSSGQVGNQIQVIAIYVP